MSFELPGRPARAAILLMLAIIVVIGACSREKASESPATFTLLSNPAALDNALARCNQSSASIEDQECRDVRAALARLADDRRKENGAKARRAQAQAQAQAQIQFEQQRDALRQQQETERTHNALERQKAAVDPYTMPFVPPESPGKPQAKPESAPVPAPAPEQLPHDAAGDAAGTHVVASDLELGRQ